MNAHLCVHISFLFFFCSVCVWALFARAIAMILSLCVCVCISVHLSRFSGHFILIPTLFL